MSILTALYISLGILLIFLGFCISFGFIAFKKSFTRRVYEGDQIEAAIKKVGNRPYCEEFVKGIEWFRDFKEKEEVSIKSFDNLTLKGYYMKNQLSNGRVMILCHGYRSFPFFDYCASAKKFYEEGFDLLFIVQRTHCESEGKFITFGIKERYDLKSWIDYVDKRHENKAKIILAGVSMGAATVMFTLGLKLPESVRGAICDCGFDCPRRIIAFALKDVFKKKAIASFMSYFVSFASLFYNGKFLGSVSTRKTLKNCTLPIMFLHGKADDVVPFEMSEKSYAYPKGYKSFVTSEKAAHGLVFYYETEKYMEEFMKLVKECGMS